MDALVWDAAFAKKKKIWDAALVDQERAKETPHAVLSKTRSRAAKTLTERRRGRNRVRRRMILDRGEEAATTV
jgi:hypothetical protein